MCGLCGYIGHPDTADALTGVVRRMSDTIRHRGPDDSGEFIQPEVGLALGFRRLSIIDLSPEGHQPMASASGRWVIAFNGEIYNYEQVRAELMATGHPHAWRGHSDTEVILAAIERWGMFDALKRFNGMFAMALWDREERTLQLARDRVGEKPLYYGWVGEDFLFGSELKTLTAHPRWVGEIDREAVASFLRYNAVSAPRSIWRGIAKLTPGTLLTLPWDGGRPRRELTIREFWSAEQAVERGRSAPFRGSDQEATDELERLLRDSVRMRMHADVPLGAFLSGGVDSSTVVALMQAQSARRVQTFTVGFSEDGFNEATYAAAVAAHLGTEHQELYVSSREALDVVPQLPTMYDEPFADSSQIPTHLVAALARRSVTVALSGDGGDELFAGYTRHTVGPRLWDAMKVVPRPLRMALASAMVGVPRGLLSATLGPIIGAPRLRHLDELSRYLRVRDRQELYRALTSTWPDPPALMFGSPGGDGERSAPPIPSFASFTDDMCFRDLIGYLPNDILAKVDRATMAVSLEGRMPILDHRIIEFAWRLPLAMKIRAGRGKWLLRQVLYRHVPPALIDRPKAGFGVPLDRWLREGLRPWAESLLDPTRMRTHGVLDPVPVRRVWDEHVSGKANRSNQLWNVLMLEAWLSGQRVDAAH